MIVEPIPAPEPGVRPPLHARREIVNALAYWVRTGCAWRLLPHDLPPWPTVYRHCGTELPVVQGAAPRADGCSSWLLQDFRKSDR
ncbi:transposase [Spirillospora sp. NPDC127200]